VDNLNAFSIFVRVVETGGFSAAARDLSISKSAVSKQIARLEDRLGVRLLNRTTRKLSPTEAGIAFYERAATIVGSIEEAERAVTALHATPQGTLRINAPMSFGIRHVSPALPDFLATYPDITIDLTLNDRIVDLVDEGYDLAIRIGRMKDSSLIAKRLAPLRPIVCATPEYWRAYGKPSHPEQLKEHNCLMFSYLSTGSDWYFWDQGKRLPVSVSGNLHVNNGDALRTAALAGLGVILSPSFIIDEELRAGAFEPALQAFMNTGGGIYIVYPHNRHLSAKVRAYVDFMAKRCGPAPYWDAP